MEIYLKISLFNRLKNLRNPTNEKTIISNKTDKPHVQRTSVPHVKLKNANDKSDNKDSKNPKPKYKNMKKTMLMVGDVLVNDIEESKLSRTCHIWVKPI